MQKKQFKKVNPKRSTARKKRIRKQVRHKETKNGWPVDWLHISNLFKWAKEAQEQGEHESIYAERIKNLMFALTRLYDMLVRTGTGNEYLAANLYWPAYELTETLDWLILNGRGHELVKPEAQARFWWPILCSANKADRKRHIEAIMDRIDLGSRTLGGRRKRTGKSYSLEEDSVNRFIYDMIYVGGVKYEDQWVFAPWSPCVADFVKTEQPPCPPFTEKTLRIWLNRFVMPFLKETLSNDADNLSKTNVPAFKDLLGRLSYPSDRWQGVRKTLKHAITRRLRLMGDDSAK